MTMDAQTIYAMLKPHLGNLDDREKKILSALICREEPKKITSQHRKVLPISKAKETLKLNREIFAAEENREKEA